MITSMIIAILMSWGVISTPADYHNASQETQEHYREIVIEDDLGQT